MRRNKGKTAGAVIALNIILVAVGLCSCNAVAERAEKPAETEKETAVKTEEEKLVILKDDINGESGETIFTAMGYTWYVRQDYPKEYVIDKEKKEIYLQPAEEGSDTLLRIYLEILED